MPALLSGAEDGITHIGSSGRQIVSMNSDGKSQSHVVAYVRPSEAI
jgi:hypothetical protein